MSEDPIFFYRKFLKICLDENERNCDLELSKINKKAIITINTPIYATLSHFLGCSLETTKKVHKLILLEAQRILFLDIYYESGLIEHKKRSEDSLESLKSLLKVRQRRSLIRLEDKLFSYWDLEKKLSGKLQQKKAISSGDIEKITRKKSTDVFLYSLIVSFFVSFPKSVVSELYKQQLERDLKDDFEDLKEDFSKCLPNPFLLHLYRKGELNFDEKLSQKDLEVLAKKYRADFEQFKVIKKVISGEKKLLGNDLLWLKSCK